MSTPDADDASPSPDYSGDQDGSDMAEQKLDNADDGSPSQKTANGSKSASNAKDPLRPRRKKARRACFACQRAHLTCSDERPCARCIKRNLGDSCMDGVRKKAKYLHDAPDGALMPGVGGSYPHMAQDPAAVPLSQQYYTQAPSATYYAQNGRQGQVPSSQDGQPIGAYNGHQAPISPPYSQSQQNSIPQIAGSVSQEQSAQVPPFGGLPFDPSDPGLFNFDISSLNFGNHYGALEMGMLGHMSSGAAETPPNDVSSMNPMNQAAGMYNQQIPYSDSGGMSASISFAPDGVPLPDWQNPHSRHGSLQMQTPNNTPTTATLDHHGQRQDSLHGPHAYAIGQGPSSISSASPASTDVNAATFDNDNPASTANFFANAGQQRMHQSSPTVSRYQQENRLPNPALQPVQSNVIRKRRRDTKWIYEGITKPYDYTSAFHRLFNLARKKYSMATFKKIQMSMAKYRPVFLASAGDLDQNDLIYQEKNLQRCLQSLEEFYSDVGTPSLICRRSGEVVRMNKEFCAITGWDRNVLLGKEPNLNVNFGTSRDRPSDSGLSTRTSSTPIMSGQEPDSGPHPVSIIELMDERSVVEWFEDFYELAYLNSRGIVKRRVNMLRYRTKEDMAKLEELKSNAASNGKHGKQEPAVKLEGGPVHRGEAAMGMLGAKDGLIDCMISWHVKRDTLDMPMLLCMHVLPVMPFLDRQA